MGTEWLTTKADLKFKPLELTMRAVVCLAFSSETIEIYRHMIQQKLCIVISTDTADYHLNLNSRSWLTVDDADGMKCSVCLQYASADAKNSVYITGCH
jgi:hypothetical protein